MRIWVQVLGTHIKPSMAPEGRQRDPWSSLASQPSQSVSSGFSKRLSLKKSKVEKQLRKTVLISVVTCTQGKGKEGEVPTLSIPELLLEYWQSRWRSRADGNFPEYWSHIILFCLKSAKCPKTTVEKSNRTPHLKKALTFIHTCIPILMVPVSHKHQASALNISINGRLFAPISQAPPDLVNQDWRHLGPRSPACVASNAHNLQHS